MEGFLTKGGFLEKGGARGVWPMVTCPTVKILGFSFYIQRIDNSRE